MDTIKLKKHLQIWKIAKISLKHNFIVHFIISVVIILLTPVLFGTSDLGTTASAVPLEIFVSLIGIVLLTPVFQPEQNSEIEEVVTCKYVSSISVSIIRIVYSIVSLIVLIGLFAMFMRICRCSIPLSLIFGSIATAMFLGAIGMLTASISNNIAVSYMIPMVYYVMNFAGGSKLGNFYLFSMMRGEYHQKIWLFGASIIIIAIAIITKRIIEKCR